MALTYGFYNSINGDRTYDAEAFGKMFDGVITDGVFPSIGDHFEVVSKGVMNIAVKPGKAWFNHTWTYLDSEFPLTIDNADPEYSRIDIVVLEIDPDSRINSIKILKGEPSSEPIQPSITSKQHQIASIRIEAGVQSITQNDITNYYGTSVLPKASIVHTIDESYVASINGMTGDVNIDTPLKIKDGITENSECKHEFSINMSGEERQVNDEGVFRVLLDTEIPDIRAITIGRLYSIDDASLFSEGSFIVERMGNIGTTDEYYRYSGAVQENDYESIKVINLVQKRFGGTSKLDKGDKYVAPISDGYYYKSSGETYHRGFSTMLSVRTKNKLVVLYDVSINNNGIIVFKFKVYDIVWNESGGYSENTQAEEGSSVKFNFKAKVGILE